MSVTKGPSHETAATAACKALPDRFAGAWRPLWQAPCGACVDAPAGEGRWWTLEEVLPFSPRLFEGRKGEPADVGRPASTEGIVGQV
jgi:hypothetical protein